MSGASGIPSGGAKYSKFFKQHPELVEFIKVTNKVSDGKDDDELTVTLVDPSKKNKKK